MTTAQRLTAIEQRLDRLEVAILALVDVLPSVPGPLPEIREAVTRRKVKGESR